MKKIKIIVSLLTVMLSGIVYAQPGATVATGSGQPGTLVPIAIGYLGTGSGVVGVQWDVNYDAVNLTADLTNCGATLGGTAINCANPSAGVIRFTGFSGTLTEIPTGALGTIDFTIGGGVMPPVTFPLTVSNEVYSDAALNSVPPVGSSDGQVDAVLGPQPDWSSAPAGGSTLTFPTVIAGGANQTQLVSVTNAGAAGSTLTGTCALSGATDPELTITSGAAVSLAQGVSSDVNLSCDATAAGTFTGSLDCTHNGDGTTEASPVSYPLSCTVSPPGAAQYASTPADGGTVQMTTGAGTLQGSAAPTGSIDISNPAPNATDNDLDLVGCTYAGDAAISVTSTNPLTTALAPQSAATATVAFSCDTAVVGNFTGTYTCPYSTDGDTTVQENTASYTVNCDIRAAQSVGNPANGASSNASITAPPGGSTTNTVVTFSETNNEGLDITDLSCTLATGTDFAVVTAMPATIPAGGSIGVDVSFTDPAVAGPFADVMTCTYTDSAGVATVTVNLTGAVRAVVVPALSWVGYAAMMLGLLFVGFIGFRRRA
jgi:hypothetical protein